MLCGAGKARIALDDVLPFDGFDFVHDPVYARAVVFQSSLANDAAKKNFFAADEAAQRRACIVSLDITSIAPRLLAALRDVASREAGCEGAGLWVCASHTFSVPHVRTPSHLASDEERRRNDRLLEAYVDAVQECVRLAVDSLCESRLYWGVGTTAVNVNRDVPTPAGWWLGLNPEGFSDHSLRVLSIRDVANGAQVATLYSADVQPSVLCGSREDDGRRAVSGDLCDATSTFLEERLGGVALFLVGAAGDQSPRQMAVVESVRLDGTRTSADAGGKGYQLVDELGHELCEDVASVLPECLPVGGEGISAQFKTVECPGQVRAEFHSLAPHHQFDFQPAEPVATRLSALKIGELSLVGMEPELSSRTGNAIRAAAGAPERFVDVVTMVNGAAKYLPDSSAYDRVTYESMNSGFACGSDQVISKACQDALGEAQKGDRL